MSHMDLQSSHTAGTWSNGVMWQTIMLSSSEFFLLSGRFYWAQSINADFQTVISALLGWYSQCVIGYIRSLSDYLAVCRRHRDSVIQHFNVYDRPTNALLHPRLFAKTVYCYWWCGILHVGSPFHVHDHPKKVTKQFLANCRGIGCPTNPWAPRGPLCYA
jgi:hypothetical protein